MKRLLGILIATVMTTASQASTSQSGNVDFGKSSVTATQPKIVIQNARAHVKPKKIINAKVVRFVPLGANDDDDIFVQEEDLATGYRRRDLNKIEHDDGISEHVRWRLFLARQLALLKHRQVFG